MKKNKKEMTLFEQSILLNKDSKRRIKIKGIEQAVKDNVRKTATRPMILWENIAK